MHQLSGLMDGRRIAAFFDECRFYMEPLKRMIDDYTLTGRKKELMCWLVAQQPTHFTDSDIGMSLMAQCRTKIIFPDANYDDDDLRKLKLSEPAIRQIRQDMTVGSGRQIPAVAFARAGDYRVRPGRPAAALNPFRAPRNHQADGAAQGGAPGITAE